ncbi:MAG: GNAT family N-acetyltransferase [Gemmatimonadales bacterium]|jgi:GNAT superfamily N-acetyltransferase
MNEPGSTAMDGVVRRARPDEASLLTELAYRSKAHWGYDCQFMEACRATLRVSARLIARADVYVAELDGRVVGFYSLAPWHSDLELYHFFVDPPAMGNGVGRRLWDDAVRRATELGYAKLLIQSDPFAEGFYLKLGAERIGEVPSGAVPDRTLPLLVFPLREGDE